MHQAFTVIGDAMIFSNEVVLWLCVVIAIFLFHRFLNFIIRDRASRKDEEQPRADGLKLHAE